MTEELPISKPAIRFSLLGLLCAVTVVAMLIAIVTPAVMAAREQARRMQTANDVRQIGLAMHNYHDVFNGIVLPVRRNSTGLATHSWRMMLVPYLEAEVTYGQYDHGAAWDSPQNASLCNYSARWYEQTWAENATPFATNFVVVTGTQTVFPHEGDSLAMDQIPDGASCTILTVEIDRSDILWYEPRDLSFDALSFRINDFQQKRNSLGNRSSHGMTVGPVDGSTRFLPSRTSPEMVRSLLTVNGGEHVRLPEEE